MFRTSRTYVKDFQNITYLCDDSPVDGVCRIVFILMSHLMNTCTCDNPNLKKYSKYSLLELALRSRRRDDSAPSISVTDCSDLSGLQCYVEK